MILVDTGPLVALIHAGDSQHEVCKIALQEIEEPMVTVWPVLTEAVHLLGFSWRAQDAVLELLRREALTLLGLEAEDVPRIRELMRQYRDLPMDLADAALVRAAERERIRRVFTLDRKDFQIYRPRRLGHFELIPE